MFKTLTFHHRRSFLATSGGQTPFSKLSRNLLVLRFSNVGILVVYQRPCSTHLCPVNPAIDTEKTLNNSHLTYMVYEKWSTTITFSLPIYIVYLWILFFFFFSNCSSINKNTNHSYQKPYLSQKLNCQISEPYKIPNQYGKNYKLARTIN